MSTSRSSALTQIGLAGASNALAASVTNPIDVVKVRLQMQGEGVRTNPTRSAAATLTQVVRVEGLTGLYRGLQTSLLREVSYSGIRMGLYEPAKTLIADATGASHTSLTVKVASGALTGGVGSILANPLDLVKVRMQSATGAPPFASIGAALRAAFAEGGVSGLWRGCTPTVQRAALLTASQVPAYDHAKHWLLDAGYVREGYACHFACSMLAGVVAALVTSPSDLVKSRMMAQPVCTRTGMGTLYSSAGSCYVQVIAAEGPLALFKGFHSQWLRIGPHTTLSLMAFEQARRLVGLSYL